MALLLAFFAFLMTSVSAEVPEPIKKIIKEDNPEIQFRFDDMLQQGNKIWVLTKPLNPLLTACKENEILYLIEGPCAVPTEASDKEAIELVNKTNKGDYLFSNSWIYTPMENNTIKSFDYYPEIFQEVLMQSQISQSFLVPEGFKLPRDLAMLAGRLPVELSSVELATDREVIYKERVKLEEASKAFEFLSYSFQTGIFNSIKINHNPDKSVAGISTKIEKEISDSIKYASKIKKLNKEVFISDQIEGKIYQLTRNVETQAFDASKPLDNEQKVSQSEAPYELNLFFDIRNYFKENNGIKDFAFNQSKTNLYLLSALDSKLHIIDIKHKLTIKSIELPASVDGMQIVSRGPSEPDKLVFRSRSGSKVFLLNTFDYRISSVLNLETMSEEYRFIPNDLLVTDDYILVATEALYKSPKKTQVSSGKILALDPITGTLTSLIDIDFIPYNIDFSSTNKEFFVLGNNGEAKLQIAKMDAKKLKLIKKEDLSPDIIDAKSFSISSAGNFILVPSEDSNQVGVVDIETCTLVKKLDLGSPSSYILAL